MDYELTKEKEALEIIKRKIYIYICDTKNCDGCNILNNCSTAQSIKTIDDLLNNVSKFHERLKDCTKDRGTKQHVLLKEYEDLFYNN